MKKQNIKSEYQINILDAHYFIMLFLFIISGSVDMVNFYGAVSAIWFGGTVFDTNDISTIRGSSMALLFAPDALLKHLHEEYKSAVFEPIVSGASNLIFQCKTDDGKITQENVSEYCEAFFRNKSEVLFSHHDGAKEQVSFDLNTIKFATAFVGVDEIDVLLKSAGSIEENAKAQIVRAALASQMRRQQYAMSSTNLPTATEKGKAFQGGSVCVLDRKSPIYEQDNTSNVSKSVASRRKFGRARKHDYHMKILKMGGYPDALLQVYDKKAGDFADPESVRKRVKSIGFSHSLEDMIHDPDDRDPETRLPRGVSLNLSPALQGKLAVIHLDGNKFGKFFDKASGVEDLKTRSQNMRQLQANLLVDLLDWMVPDGDTDPLQNDLIVPEKLHSRIDQEKKDRIRLETLIWGGDEMLFVLPAWRGWEAVGVLEKALRKFIAPFEGDNSDCLTHSIGLCFANVKTPIRLMRQMADKLSDGAKYGDTIETATFGFSVGIHDAIDISDGDIVGVRKRQFGYQEKDKPDLFFKGSIGGANGADWLEITHQLQAIASLFPPSQTSYLLEKAAQIGLDKIRSGEKANDWETFLDEQIMRLKGPNENAIENVKKTLNGLKDFGISNTLDTLIWNKYLDGYILPVAPREGFWWQEPIQDSNHAKDPA